MVDLNKKHFFLLAGEPSGDLHGASLMSALKAINNNLQFSGIGGNLMLKEGFSSLVPLHQLAVMGFWEVFKNILFFLRLERVVLNHLEKSSPDKIILIDYPGFNLRLAKKIKERFNIPIIYYISPQLWAWKENRIFSIKKYIDHMVVLFPFERAWYLKKNFSVFYFGHPVIDLWDKNDYRGLSLNNKAITICLFPGSRVQEIEKHLPIFKDIIKNSNLITAKINFIISCVSPSFKKYFSCFTESNVRVECSSSFNIFKQSDLAVVSSGTATLECAVSLTPFVVVYKMSWFSWFLTKVFVSLPHFSIVNILSGRAVVEELLQNNMTAFKIIRSINSLLDSKNQIKVKKDLKKIRSSLGAGGAYQKAAQLILSN